jgi:hypothetical protein
VGGEYKRNGTEGGEIVLGGDGKMGRLYWVMMGKWRDCTGW